MKNEFPHHLIARMKPLDAGWTAGTLLSVDNQSGHKCSWPVGLPLTAKGLKIRGWVTDGREGDIVTLRHLGHTCDTITIQVTE